MVVSCIAFRSDEHLALHDFTSQIPRPHVILLDRTRSSLRPNQAPWRTFIVGPPSWRTLASPMQGISAINRESTDISRPHVTPYGRSDALTTLAHLVSFLSVYEANPLEFCRSRHLLTLGQTKNTVHHSVLCNIGTGQPGGLTFD